MKGKALFLVLAALVLLAGVLSACTQTPTPTLTPTPTPTITPSPSPITTTTTPAPKPIKLTMASPFPGPPATDSNWMVWWQEKVTKATNGRVTFENHWAGSLFAPGQMKDAVEQRFADVVQFFYGYAPSTLPLGNYQFAVPFRPTTPSVITKVHQQLWNEIPEFEKELASAKGKTLLFGPAANYDVLSRMPLKTLDDFKGKKIACVGLYFPEQVNGSGGVAISNAAGERAFCAGMDLSTIDNFTKKGKNPSRRWLTGPLAYWTMSLGELQKPTIAAVNGVAAGGGMGLALMCDIRIASENAKFVPAFAERGLALDNETSYTLPRIVGLPKALEIVLTGKIINAPEAEKLGLVNRVVPAQRLMSEAKDMATKISNLAPVAAEWTKYCLYQSTNSDLRTQGYLESLAQARCFNTEDMDEGISSFLEKRNAKFKGK